MTDAAIQNLRLAIENHAKQIFELSDPRKRKLSYSGNGKSMTWTEYRTFLRNEIKELQSLIDAETGGNDSGSTYHISAVE